MIELRDGTKIPKHMVEYIRQAMLVQHNENIPYANLTIYDIINRCNKDEFFKVFDEYVAKDKRRI